MKSWNDEPAIQQKEYSQEEYNKKKRKSLRVAKVAGLAYVDPEALAGPMGILTRYCIQNNITMLTPRFFEVLQRILVVAQILIACSCIFVLLH